MDCGDPRTPDEMSAILFLYMPLPMLAGHVISLMVVMTVRSDSMLNDTE